MSTRLEVVRGARARRWFVLGAAIVVLLLALQLTGTLDKLAAGAAGSTGSVSGTVWGTSGPMAGVVVSAESSYLSYALATTDDAGHYTLTGLEPGSFSIVFVPPAGSGLVAQLYRSEVIVGQGTTRRNVDAWLRQDGKISGVVTTPEGYYARNTSVCAYGGSSGIVISSAALAASGAGSDGPSGRGLDAGTSTTMVGTTVIGTGVPTTSRPPAQPTSSCVVTDNAGRFTTAGLPAGSYTVSFSPYNGRYQYFDGVTGGPGSSPKLVVLGDGQTQLGVNAVLKPPCGAAFGDGCGFRFSTNGCFIAQLTGDHKVKFQYQCNHSFLAWHTSDDQTSMAEQPELTFSGDGPFTMQVDATLSTTVTSDSLTFSFTGGSVTPTQAPGAPYGVLAQAGVEQAQVSWIEPIATVGPITQYVVTASPGGATCTWTTGPRACTVKGLPAGVAHTFTVTATNAIGTGPASGPSNAATPTARRFLDVPVTSAFYAHIEWLASEKVTTGFADGTFHGSAGVQRQAMAAFLYRMAGSPNGTSPSCSSAPFTDVPVGAPFCGEIAWLKSTGITTGSGGLFNPKATVSRAAMAAFLYRFSGSPGGNSPACTSDPFTDVAVGSPFCGEIAWLKSKGISTGNGDGTFKPSALVTREAMAAFLHRWIDI